MPLDVPALPITSQTIKYARASYDVARDGASPGYKPIPSQQVPANAFLVGLAWQAVERLDGTGPNNITIGIGPLAMGIDGDVTDDFGGAKFLGTGANARLDSSFPISLSLSQSDATQGQLYLYVFYV